MLKRYVFLAIVAGFSASYGMEEEYVKDVRQLCGEKDLYFSLLPKDVLGIAQDYRLNERIDRALRFNSYSGIFTDIWILAQLPEYTQMFNNANFVDGVINSISSKFGKDPEEVAQDINTLGMQLWLTYIRPNQIKLMDAAACGDLVTVQQLITVEVNVNARDTYGNTALILAAIYGHIEIVKELIKAAANLNAQTDDGRTALMWAAINGHTALMKILIDAGADVNARSNTGRTALMWAAHQGHTEVVKELLVTGADVNARDKDGDTVLDLAQEEGYKDIIKLLKQNTKK